MANAAYVLCCESTTDADEQFHIDRNLKYICFNYELDGEIFKDDFGKTHSPTELFKLMLGGAEAHTSQISVGDYMDMWRPYLEAGQDVLHVTLTSGISGTYNSACTARDNLASEFPERKIFVVDSLCASSGYGLLMDRLASLRDAGLTVDELADWATNHRLEVQTWFFSTDLTFFIRGGRISKTAGLIGGALKICPVMSVAPDGTLIVCEKIRTKKKAAARVVELMRQLAKDGEDYSDFVVITNSDCLSDAKMVSDAIERDFAKIKQPVMHYNIGATIGCHTGPGTVALSYWGVPRT